jgi:hypothetical protein
MPFDRILSSPSGPFGALQTRWNQPFLPGRVSIMYLSPLRLIFRDGIVTKSSAVVYFNQKALIDAENE